LQESHESVGSGLFETLISCSIKNYSNQVWSERWKWQWYRLLWNSGKGEYSEVDGYEYDSLAGFRQRCNSIRKDEVFIKDEVKMTSRGSGVE